MMASTYWAEKPIWYTTRPGNPPPKLYRVQYSYTFHQTRPGTAGTVTKTLAERRAPRKLMISVYNIPVIEVL